VLAAGSAAGVARAQDTADPDDERGGAHRFQPPPAPGSVDPVLGGEVHVIAVSPLAREPLCPPDAACVFSGGGGIGVSLERRWPEGLSIMLGYEAWFLDSNTVYELAVLQGVRAMLRYLLFQRSAVHPFGAVGIGALIFGDTLTIAAIGGALDVGVGLEVELTETFSLVVMIPARFFITSSFVTPRDKTHRAEEGGVNSALSLHIGLAVLGWD
jgi:hypothetical protein